MEKYLFPESQINRYENCQTPGWGGGGKGRDGGAVLTVFTLMHILSRYFCC